MTVRIAHVASEVVPFSKTGGLADVLGALPPALVEAGAEVTVITPGHRQSLKEALPGEPIGEVSALGQTATMRALTHRGVRVVLLDCPALFARPALYSLPDGDFPDNPIRFAFLARAALAALARLGGADVVHVHDWQAALAPLLLRFDDSLAASLPGVRTVLSIHNMAYQGVFPGWVLEPSGLPSWMNRVDLLEFYGQVNFLKGGLVSADAISTVSPTYAREILTPEFGCRLEGVLAGRASVLSGILNGIDGEEWNPAHDRHLDSPYAIDDATDGKRAARRQLAAELGPPASARPLLGMVSRLAEQKGADLFAAAVDEIVALGFDVVVLGTGERRLEEAIRAAEVAHPERVRVALRFDERLAHEIYAASDFFLMPSRYEPCGLGQMIAMRYGSLPVVHRTGGLADTVTDASRPDGDGFVFSELSPAALVEALSRAAEAHRHADRLAALRRVAMQRDFSWRRSAGDYLALYRSLSGKS